MFTHGKWVDYVRQAEDKVSRDEGRVQIPKYFDTIDLSFQTYASWYKDDALGHMFDFYKPKYDFPVLSQIKVPVHIVVGTHDEFFHPSDPSNPQAAMDILLKHIPTSSGKLIQGAVHSFKGHEDEVAVEVTAFCS